MIIKVNQSNIYDIISAMSLDKLFENRIRSMLGDEYDDFEKALEKGACKSNKDKSFKTGYSSCKR